MSLTYTYPSQLQPGEIRLLKLDPRPKDGPIICRLEVYDAGSVPYHAVSYAWGSPDLDHELQCDGKVLPVTKSLHTLLRALRPGDSETMICLWADAVCINQKDIDERIEQVRRMSDIYREAESVIVWLGEGYEDTEEGLKLLAQTCKVYPSPSGEDIENLWLDTEEQGFQSAAELISLGLLDTSSGGWQTAGKLLEYAWFTRRWVLQEVLNARKRIFQIGKYQVTPEVLLGGLFRLASMSGLRFALTEGQRRLADNVDNMVQLLRRPRDVFSHEALAELLLETANFQSFDIRDRVFAIIGCFDNPPARLIDYRKSFPELLVDIVKCERGRKSLVEAVFRGFCYIDDLPTDPSIPSWVPTWNFSTQFFMPLNVDEDDSNIDPEQADLEVINNSILESGVIFFDEVKVCAEVQEFEEVLPRWDQTPKQQHQVLEMALRKDCEIRMRCLQLAKDVSDSDNFDLKAFLECHIFSFVPEDMDVVASYTVGMQYSALFLAHSEATDAPDLVRRYHGYLEGFQCPHDDTLGPNSAQEDTNDRLQELGSTGEYTRLNTRLKYGRCFFASHGGRIGWVPKAAQKGDRICVLFGNAMPIVLRPQGAFGGISKRMTYRLSGAAYVHGHMDGEIFRDDSRPRERIGIV